MKRFFKAVPAALSAALIMLSGAEAMTAFSTTLTDLSDYGISIGTTDSHEDSPENDNGYESGSETASVNITEDAPAEDGEEAEVPGDNAAPEAAPETKTAATEENPAAAAENKAKEKAVTAARPKSGPTGEKIVFSDKKSGIKFSLALVHCSTGKSDGKIVISLENKSSGYTYSYSSDEGKSFNLIKGKTAEINSLKKGSYSFCLKKKGKKETVSDIYTVYLKSDTEKSRLSAAVKCSPEIISGDGTITVYPRNTSSGKSYEVSVDGGKRWYDINNSSFSAADASGGKYRVIVREKGAPENASVEMSVNIPAASSNPKGYIKVAPLLQNPELPTGCEVTSLAMLLDYLGLKTNKMTLAQKYLPKGEYRKSDFNEVFVGDPTSENAYGCFAGVIEKTAKAFLKDRGKSGEFKVRNITGCAPSKLYSAIDSGSPVIVWVSIDMGDITENSVSWTDEKTGKTVSWTSGEHCVLLTGYDRTKGIVYVNDPLYGSVSYNMRLFELRFSQFGKNAVMITENN